MSKRKVAGVITFELLFLNRYRDVNLLILDHLLRLKR